MTSGEGLETGDWGTERREPKWRAESKKSRDEG
jgi:hypothetical protein